MKFKKLLIPAAMLILTACSAQYSEINEISEISETSVLTISETVTEMKTETSPETEWINPALAPARLADRSLSAFTVKGSITIHDEQSRTITEYSGEITDEEDIAAVRDFITFTESAPSCETNEYYRTENSVLVSLILENDNGEKFWYHEKSFRENGEESGFIFRSGVYGKDTICIPTHGPEGNLYSLMEKIIAKEDNIISQESYPVDGYPKGAVLIREYRNWAWGYQHMGDLIDENGNVYPFDFSDDDLENEVRSEKELLSRIMKIYAEGNPESAQYENYSDTLKKIPALADKVDKRAKLVSENTACDAGQYTIYALTSDFRLITVCSEGDSSIISTDENASEIQRLCGEIGIFSLS
ncbi:MAG: hypothetical protein MSJ26_01005 [Oscillospiraceae bacterium]|nr:hypothetical protein [Oscillospiraceae bacterium]